jgi:hypothetical protein
MSRLDAPLQFHRKTLASRTSGVLVTVPALMERLWTSTFKGEQMKKKEEKVSKLVLNGEQVRVLDARPDRGGEFCLRSMALAINA